MEETEERMRAWEELDERRKRSLTFVRNRRKILRTVPEDQKRAYIAACDEAWKKGESCPPWPFGKVSSLVEL